MRNGGSHQANISLLSERRPLWARCTEVYWDQSRRNMVDRGGGSSASVIGAARTRVPLLSHGPQLQVS